MKLRWLSLPAALALTILAIAPALGADKPSPNLVSEQLVVSKLDFTGLPLKSELVTQVIAIDRPYGKVLVPTSTTELRYLDKRGAPDVEDSNAVVMIGGPGQQVVLLGSTFSKPLPVGLHAEYVQDGVTRDPTTVGGEGELAVKYTVTNTVVTEQTITYKDAGGKTFTSKQPVFAPFAGALVVTLPPEAEVTAAPGAVRSTGQDGGTVLTWKLVLYPPLGDPQQSPTMTVRSRNLAIPGARLDVLPVTSAEDPAVGFSRDLIDKSVKGNAQFADGLTELNDSAVKLADGAAKVADGLAQISAGTDQLSQVTSSQLVPGAQQLADGASQQSQGEVALAQGVGAASTGAASLASGTEQLAKGLDQLAGGLDALAAPSGLPAAAGAAASLAEAVNKLADAVGTPSDPPAEIPAPSNVTLVQLAEGSAVAADAIKTAAGEVSAALEELGPDLAAASTAAGAAAAQVEDVYAAACGDTPTLTPEQCASLADAASQAGSASVDTAAAGAKVEAQAEVSRGVALGLGGLSRALDALLTGLEQVSTALRSGDPSSPGIGEGLDQLADGLTEAVTAVSQLSTGAIASAGGAHALADGATELSSGLDQASSGAQVLAGSSAQLASGAAGLASGTAQMADALTSLNAGLSTASQGSADLATGAHDFQVKGTAATLAGVVKASKDPAFARAYLNATTARAAHAAPYAAPAGGVARVAYVSEITAGTGDGGADAARTTALWALAAALVLALGVLAVLRIRSAPPA